MPLLSTISYVLMGWIAIVAVVPISRALEPAALYWLITGGIAYTGGTLFYHNRRIPYSHAIWHLFVLTGSVSHFIAILLQFTPDFIIWRRNALAPNVRDTTRCESAVPPS